MREKEYLLEVCEEFFDPKNVIEIKELTTGNINETYLIKFADCKYILQLLNSHVYYSPIGVMNNTRLIVDHIRKKCIYQGKNPHKAVLNFIKTRFGQDLAIVNDEYWRCSEYIEDAYSLEKVSDEQEFYEIGKAVGNFQQLLSDFHPEVLDDTIKQFHDTPERFKKLKELIDLNYYDRVKNCQNEIEFICMRQNKFDILIKELKKGSIPKRVTHNDTKASNIMLDSRTKKYLCLIDLDTVMKGTLLFDYGDALRFGASNASEDEIDLSHVDLNLDFVKAFTKGFLEELKGEITPFEIALLYEGLWIITIELGMRFLSDYLDGDKYFRTSKLDHNLIRAKNQLDLTNKIEQKELQIKKIINDVLKELGYENEYLIRL
ncbi:MAG: aminoglycoside phosphotransferase family protein [Bacilli bacterium]|nr:aminoglycoside phosphotransferase family protein [Bacilli bacterium]